MFQLRFVVTALLSAGTHKRNYSQQNVDFGIVQHFDSIFAAMRNAKGSLCAVSSLQILNKAVCRIVVISEKKFFLKTGLWRNS